jgi:hypothetical protein
MKTMVLFTAILDFFKNCLIGFEQIFEKVLKFLTKTLAYC